VLKPTDRGAGARRSRQFFRRWPDSGPAWSFPPASPRGVCSAGFRVTESRGGTQYLRATAVKG
jgi:hypothetical protein